MLMHPLSETSRRNGVEYGRCARCQKEFPTTHLQPRRWAWADWFNRLALGPDGLERQPVQV